MTLEFVFGYRAKESRNNIKYLKNGVIVALFAFTRSRKKLFFEKFDLDKEVSDIGLALFFRRDGIIIIISYFILYLFSNLCTKLESFRNCK